MLEEKPVDGDVLLFHGFHVGGAVLLRRGTGVPLKHEPAARARDARSEGQDVHEHAHRGQDEPGDDDGDHAREPRGNSSLAERVVTPGDRVRGTGVPLFDGAAGRTTVARGDKKLLDLAIRLGDLAAAASEKDTAENKQDYEWEIHFWLDTFRLLERELGHERRARWRKEFETIVAWFAVQVAGLEIVGRLVEARQKAVQPQWPERPPF